MPKKHHSPLLRFTSRKIKGFTLIELLISVAIIAILSVLSIASFQGSTRRQEVKGSAAELKADLRKTQNYATSGQKRPNNDSTCESEVSRSYTILASIGFYLPFFLAGPTPLPDPPPWGFCYVTLRSTYPISSNVRVERVGQRRGATGSDSFCAVVVSNFRPLNERPTLHCDPGFVWDHFLNPSIPTSLSGGNDRIFFQLRSRNTSETLRYRVYVTDQGVIYDEKQP